MRNLVSRIASISIFLLSTVSVFAQECGVKFTAPKAEEWVMEQGDVVGTGSITKDSFLWILVRRDDEPKKFFWPQQGLPAKDVNGKPQWKISAHYGVTDDRGHDFKVIGVVVDQATNARLEKWREEALENNYKPLVGMPSSISGCDPVEVVVKKSE